MILYFKKYFPIKKGILSFLLILVSQFSLATHNKGGRIEANEISSFRFEITIYTYTKTSSIQADRPSLDSVYAGDGSSPEVFNRISKTDLPNDVSLNIYRRNHTYNSTGFFTVHFEDPNLNANIINVPHSVSVPLYLETTIFIDSSNCFYRSPNLLSIPIFKTPLGKDLNLSRAAYDLNWDSLSYNFDTSLIAGYFIPNGVTLNSLNGELKWIGDSLQVWGEYFFMIRITKWRKGIYSGHVLEDFIISSFPVADSVYNFNTTSYPIDFTSHLLPDSLFTLHVEYYDSTLIPSIEFYSELNNGLRFTGTSNNHLFSGDFNWTPSVQNCRNTPYILQFRGRKDLTYQLFVDGNPTDTCRALIGIDEISYLKDWINIFPNPTKGTFQVSFDRISKEKIKLTIFDLNGKILIEKFTLTENTIDISRFSSGIYFLKFDVDDNSYYSKILKN